MRLRRRRRERTEPKRRVSLTRLVGVLAIVAATVVGMVWVTRAAIATFAAEETVLFAPYVDITLRPTTYFEDPLENRSNEVVLGFIVADPSDGCRPTWGTYYSIDAAGRALDLDRRIVPYRERGGEIIVSFGGEANHELAITCTDVDRLAQAYTDVIERYHATALDFDIEGSALVDEDANRRRAEALSPIQDAHESLQLWLTVPVAPTGLTSEGINLIDTTLAGGVDLTGVNIMTMNFGGSRPSGTSMGAASVDALQATQRQLHGLFQRHGELV